MLKLKKIIGVLFLGVFLLTSSTAFGALNGNDYMNQKNDAQKDMTATEETVAVKIDVLPGDDQNTIDPKTDKTLEVALLGSKDFDVNKIAQDSVTWNDEAIEGEFRIADINNDGFDDLVQTVHTKDLDLKGDSAEITVKGKTDSGEKFEGSDMLTLASSEKDES